MLNVTLPPHRLVVPANQVDRQLRKKTASVPQPMFSGDVTQINPDPNSLQSVKDAKERGAAPLLLANQVTSKTENPEVIRYLVKEMQSAGKNIDAAIIPPLGVTMLHVAISAGRPNIVATLLEMGANPLQADKRDRTAIDWLEKISDRVTPKNREKIHSLIMNRLSEMAQPKAGAEKKADSSWSFWPFGGGAQKEAPESSRKALPMISEEVQTEPVTLPSQREQALLGELDDLRLSDKQSRKQLSESVSKLNSQETQLKEATEANRQLQEKMKRLDRENRSLQSTLQTKLENARNEQSQLEARLNESEEAAERSEREHQAELGKLKAENSRIQKLLDEGGQAAAGEQSRLQQALSKALKEKDEKGKLLEQARQDHQTQLGKLRDENRKAQKKLTESEQSRRKIQEDAQTQSRKQKEENYSLRKELIEQTDQLSELRAQLETQKERLEQEATDLREQLSRQGAHRGQEQAESEAKLAALQQDNEKLDASASELNQQLQLLQEQLRKGNLGQQRLQQQLREEQVARAAEQAQDDERHKGMMEVNEFFRAASQKALHNLEQRRQAHMETQERLMGAEMANQTLHDENRHQQWHMNALSDAWRDVYGQLEQRDTELDHAYRKQSLLSRAMESSMAHSARHSAKFQRRSDIYGDSLVEVLEGIAAADNVDEAWDHAQQALVRQRERNAANNEKHQPRLSHGLEALSVEGAGPLKKQGKKDSRPHTVEAP